MATASPSDLVLGAATVCFGAERGKYPEGNSLFVRGPEESLVIDPSLGLVPRRGALPRADRVLNSHCHEDHVAGNHLFPGVPWHLHEADLPGMLSLDGFLAIFGYGGPIMAHWRKAVVEQFHFTPRPDAVGFADGHVFDLGGGVRVRAIHTPGHTPDHMTFVLEDAALVGDCLLVGTVGRADFYDDGPEELYQSIFDRILRLSDEVAVYPAHYGPNHGLPEDRSTTIGRERRFNDALTQTTKEDFVRYMVEGWPPKPAGWREISERNTSP